MNIFFTPVETSPYFKVHKRYDYSQLEQIFDESDVVIVPSIWYETFGYVALEALSYGVPVIISDHVGAKDIVQPEYGVIIPEMTQEKLKEEILSLNPVKLAAMNKNICEKFQVMDISEMCCKIMQQCYGQTMESFRDGNNG